jgi:hypothetical protein
MNPASQHKKDGRRDGASGCLFGNR